MAGINVTRFVDVNITKKTTTTISGTRPTVALLTAEGTASNVNVVNASNYKSYYTTTSTPNTRAYLDVYFDHGGVQCAVFEGTTNGSGSGGVDAIVSALANLEREQIVVGVVSATDVSANIITAAFTYNSTAKNIDKKIFLARSDDADITSGLNLDYVAYKCASTKGYEMTIAAYLSKIDVYGVDTVQDYDFTPEKINPGTRTSDVIVGKVITNNLNMDIPLAGAIRNIGGNLMNGDDIVNTYVLIILQQTVTNRLLALLSSKIKNARGLSQIYSTLAEELENYRICGYLTTDKVWTDETYQVTREGVTYTIIEKGTPLVSGYLIRVLPLAALSAADKLEKKAPPVYIILADQYGIRKIEITGEVI